jgi:phosphoenolpyruvate-protein kinase (PTS system EI component)
LHQQFQALWRAADGGILRVKFPIIADATELETSRNLLDQKFAR